MNGFSAGLWEKRKKDTGLDSEFKQNKGRDQES